jgi:hypothetical protein
MTNIAAKTNKEISIKKIARKRTLADKNLPKEQNSDTLPAHHYSPSILYGAMVEGSSHHWPTL